MDFTNVQDKLEFVKSQCRTLPGAKYHEDYTMIRCPFHSDRNPSGRINHSVYSRSPGFFKCYGCGATATWNELAPLIGCTPFKSKPSTRYARPVVVDPPTEEREEQLLLKPLPRGKKWRTIPTNLLIDIGCELCKVQYEWGTSDPFIYLPVTVGQQLKGYTKARLHKQSDKPSYINAKGSWVKQWGLFPFDYAISMMTPTRTVVLVEGQRDALRLIAQGIPAMCIMGTQNWCDEKAKLLELYDVRRAVIFMDGDDAGIAGAHKVHKSLSKFIQTSVIKLWAIKGSPYLKFKDCEFPSQEAKRSGVELWDPNNCPQWIIDRIKHKYIGEQNGNHSI